MWRMMRKNAKKVSMALISRTRPLFIQQIIRYYYALIEFKRNEFRTSSSFNYRLKAFAYEALCDTHTKNFNRTVESFLRN